VNRVLLVAGEHFNSTTGTPDILGTGGFPVLVVLREGAEEPRAVVVD
jgi:hypothetical protein